MSRIGANTLKTSVAGAILSLSGRELPSDLRTTGSALKVTTLSSENETVLLQGQMSVLQAVARTALLGSPDAFPIGSSSYLLDDEFFADYSIGGDYTVSAIDPGIARRGAYLSIGELFTYLNESRPASPSAILEHYSRTLSFAFSRSALLWGTKRSQGILNRWMLLREALGWAPSAMLPPERAWQSINLWLAANPELAWVHDIKDWLGEADLFQRAAKQISADLGLSLSDAPISFDQRFEWLSMVATRLRAVENTKSGRSSIALGLLVAAIEPGELMHLNWLRPHLKNFPDVALHYAGWSAWMAECIGRQDNVLRGLSRRIARELQRPLDFRLPPSETASLIDILSSSDPIDEINLRANPRAFSVSLVPGVIVSGGYSVGETPTRNAARTKHPSEPAANDQSSLFADESDENIQRIILKELVALRKEIAQMHSSAAKKVTRKKAP